MSLILHLGSLDCCSGVLKPVDDIVDIKRFLSLSRLQTVQCGHVIFNLETRGMIILCKPGLKFGDLVLRVKADSHSWFVKVMLSSSETFLDIVSKL